MMRILMLVIAILATSCTARMAPTAVPTVSPTASPTPSPSHIPTAVPTVSPTSSPTPSLSHIPTPVPAPAQAVPSPSPSPKTAPLSPAPSHMFLLLPICSINKSLTAHHQNRANPSPSTTLMFLLLHLLHHLNR
ncbi:hypothetical protein Tco_0407583 [Tanacetum coccineum]